MAGLFIDGLEKYFERSIGFAQRKLFQVIFFFWHPIPSKSRDFQELHWKKPEWLARPIPDSTTGKRLTV